MDQIDTGIISSQFTNCDILEIAVPTAWFGRFREFKDKTAVVDGNSGRHVTFSALLESSRRIGCGLSKLGVQKGDLVAFYAPNSIDWIFMFYGTLYCGATVTTINPLYTRYEVNHQLKDCGATYIFTTQNLLENCQHAIKDIPNFKEIICDDDNYPRCTVKNLLKIGDPRREALLDSQEWNVKEDVALVPYSSGTTGLSKGVMLTHYNIMANCSQFGHPELAGEKSPADEKTEWRYMCVVPMYHMYGMMLCLGVLVTGDTLVILNKFEPRAFLTDIEKYQVNILPLVPALVNFLAKSPLVEEFDLSCVRKVSSGAAALSTDVGEQLKTRLQVSDTRQAYGMTETTTGACVLPESRPVKPGSCGLLLPNTQAKVICPETGRVLGANEKGELCLRGPQIMKGYINNIEATEQAIDNQGFLHTGDVAYYNEEGYFFIVDRLKELIKVKGLQVAPAKLEAILISHSDVDDAAVIGVADERAGEIPRAFVVKRTGSDVTEEELHNLVNERVAPFKRITGGIFFIEEIPRVATGKILHRKLKELSDQMEQAKQ